MRLSRAYTTPRGSTEASPHVERGTDPGAHTSAMGSDLTRRAPPLAPSVAQTYRRHCSPRWVVVRSPSAVTVAGSRPGTGTDAAFTVLPSQPAPAAPMAKHNATPHALVIRGELEHERWA